MAFDGVPLMDGLLLLFGPLLGVKWCWLSQEEPIVSVDLDVGGATACQLLCGCCTVPELLADEGVCVQFDSLVGEVPFG